MRILGIHAADITAKHLAALVDDGLGESRTLEFKSELPGRADDDKKKFLSSVAALANTAGGVIVYGMETVRDASGKDTGIAQRVAGLHGLNAD